MEKYYTLSSAAGMIRSNVFESQEDAICVGSFRASELALPVKIFEHAERGEGTCVLICMPDGSVKKPEGLGRVSPDMGNEKSGFSNASEAYMLLSSYDAMPITTYYLKSDLSESAAQAIEKELGVEMGLYDPRTLHAYTEDSNKLKSLEEKLTEASVEVEVIRNSKSKPEKIQAAAELVEAARKGHKMARASRMPEMTVKASSKFGGGLRVNCHCEMVEGSDSGAPKIKVYGDGEMLGEVKSEVQASRLMAEYAQKAFAKFLKKELA
jgi:hypothetical protein